MVQTIEKQVTEVQYIPLEDLLPNPYQPETRLKVDPETAKRFALSIQEHGLIHMPVVRAGTDGKYEIGDGWLRRAGFLFNFKDFGLQDYGQLPCVVKDLTDQQMADMVMEANTVRKDLNAIELAKFYRRYLEDFKIPQAELARRHNCSQGEIANTIRLLELPADIQGKIISQEITETHGRQLLRLNHDPELQQSMLKTSIKHGWSVNELSNTIAVEQYRKTENLDPNDYPTPEFDTSTCEGCSNRVKIGQPYSGAKKSWRCQDPKCYHKKKAQAEKDRVEKIKADLAQVKGSGTEEETIMDLSQYTWRDYQAFERWKHLDNPKECDTCPKKALGKKWKDQKQPELVCIDVSCFKAKERAFTNKENELARKAEKELTDRMKAAVEKADTRIVFNHMIRYLIDHSRKDTRERIARVYGYKEKDLLVNAMAMTQDDLASLEPMALFTVLQKEKFGEAIARMFLPLYQEIDLFEEDSINKSYYQADQILSLSIEGYRLAIVKDGEVLERICCDSEKPYEPCQCGDLTFPSCYGWVKEIIKEE